jgi:hypothetical protein
MTPGSLIADLRARGVSIALTPSGRVTIRPKSKLTPDERTYLRVNARAVAARLALERMREEDREAAERQLRELGERLRARAERERLYVRAEWFASLDPRRVAALIDAGKLTAEDIVLWSEVRRVLERGLWLRLTACEIATAIRDATGGRPVRVEW